MKILISKDAMHRVSTDIRPSTDAQFGRLYQTFPDRLMFDFDAKFKTNNFNNK
jgi:hypothetical protein